MESFSSFDMTVSPKTYNTLRWLLFNRSKKFYAMYPARYSTSNAKTVPCIITMNSLKLFIYAVPTLGRTYQHNETFSKSCYHDAISSRGQNNYRRKFVCNIKSMDAMTCRSMLRGGVLSRRRVPQALILNALFTSQARSLRNVTSVGTRESIRCHCRRLIGEP